jgi:fructose-1,6-bisphosphatase I
MKDGQFDQLILPIGTTLDRFINTQQSNFPFAKGEFSQLLRDIAIASKIVNREINRAGLTNISGSYGTQNGHGEDQQKLDVVANVRFIRALKNGGEVCAIASEEDEELKIESLPTSNTLPTNNSSEGKKFLNSCKEILSELRF